MKDSLLIVDGNSLFFRQFMGASGSNDGIELTKSGHPISGTIGSMNRVLSIIEERNFTHCCFVFDGEEDTFRHELSSLYKAGRKEKPEMLKREILTFRELLLLMGMSVFIVKEFEGDDVAGSVAVMASGEGLASSILTGDRDLFQLVDDKEQRTVIYMSKVGMETVTESVVLEKMGVPASLIVDYKAIAGDSSDNIKGIRGIGSTGAVHLINKYGNLNAILQCEDMEPSYKKKIDSQVDEAHLSRALAEIVTNLPCPCISTFRLSSFDDSAARALLDSIHASNVYQIIELAQHIFARYEQVDF